MVEIRAITGKYITGSSSKQFKFPGDDRIWNLNNPTLPLIREWALRARRLMFIEMEEKGYRVSSDNAGVVVDSDNKEIKRISFMPKVIIQNSDDNYDDIKEEDIPSTIPLPNVNDVEGDSIRQKYETAPNRAVSQFKDTINNLFNFSPGKFLQFYPKENSLMNNYVKFIQNFVTTNSSTESTADIINFDLNLKLLFLNNFIKNILSYFVEKKFNNFTINFEKEIIKNLNLNSVLIDKIYNEFNLFQSLLRDALVYNSNIDDLIEIFLKKIKL